RPGATSRTSTPPCVRGAFLACPAYDSGINAWDRLGGVRKAHRSARSGDRTGRDFVPAGQALSAPRLSCLRRGLGRAGARRLPVLAGLGHIYIAAEPQGPAEAGAEPAVPP